MITALPFPRRIAFTSPEPFPARLEAALVALFLVLALALHAGVLASLSRPREPEAPIDSGAAALARQGAPAPAGATSR